MKSSGFFRTALLLSMVLVALASCQLPFGKAPATDTAIASTPTGENTITMTPFQPDGSGTAVLDALPGSSTPSLPATTSPAAATKTTPSPSAIPSSRHNFASLQFPPVGTKTPQPADALPQPNGQTSFLFFGTNQPTNTAYTTDVMILMTFRADGSVSLVSFPRDLFVYIPGWSMKTLNQAQEHGGFNLTSDTFEYNFGFKPDFYVLTNLTGFPQLIDKLGGVDVMVAKTFRSARMGYKAEYVVSPGVVHMDGATALWYCTSVNFVPTGDLERMQRTQEVMLAISQKMVSLNGLVRALDLYKIFQNYVTTSLSISDATNLAVSLIDVNTDHIESYTIGSAQVTPWFDPASKKQVLLPKGDEIRKVLLLAIGKP